MNILLSFQIKITIYISKNTKEIPPREGMENF